MKFLKSSQIKEVDAYTIGNEPIRFINLMERASRQVTRWLCQHYSTDTGIHVFVGPGNNGGDGLAVARQKDEIGYPVTVYLVKITDKISSDADINFQRLKKQDEVGERESLNLGDNERMCQETPEDSETLVTSDMIDTIGLAFKCIKNDEKYTV